MKTLLPLGLSAVVVAASTLAASTVPAPTALKQDAPSPALEPFAAMLGDWAGSGTYTKPDGEPGTWRVKLHAERAVAGHVVRLDAVLHLDGAAEPSYGSTFYGVDSHTQELGCVSIESNHEGLKRGSVMWTDKGTMVASYLSQAEGKIKAARSIWRFTEDEIHWSSDGATGADAFSPRGKGKLTRIDGGAAQPVEASHLSTKLTDDNMTPFAPFLGTYAIEGLAKDETTKGGIRAFRGEQFFRAAVGGHAVQNHWAAVASKDRPAQHGDVYYVWNPAKEASTPS